MTRTRPSGNMLGPVDESADYSRSSRPADAHTDAAVDARAAAPATAAAKPSDDPPRIALVPDALAGERLDKVLAKLFPEFSRNRLQSWTESGRVLLNGAPAKVRQAVPLDARIELTPDFLPEQLAFTPEPVPLEVVYEDDALVVIDKPAGLVVHPAAGNWSGTILNGLLHRYPDAAGLPRAGIVHRLDKETSGLMVIARTLQAQTDLVRQLQARTVKRRYVALVWGAMPAEGIIDAPIGRDSRERTRMAVVAGASGKSARTRFRLVDQTIWKQQPISAIHCDLETGRTHQIRVHCAYTGHPLLGDPVYGNVRGRRANGPLPGDFARQALHAWQLGLVHPSTGRPMRWRADLPADMADLVQALGFGQPASAFEAGEFDDDAYDEVEGAEGGYEDDDTDIE